MTALVQHAARRPNPHVVYLLPGVLAVVALVAAPLVINVGASFTDWQGVGAPAWIGGDNYRALLQDEAFWASFRHSLAMILAMALIPTTVGLVLAAALFEVIGKHFGPRAASLLRACMYLPQVLPISVAGIVWSWMLAPEGGTIDAALASAGLGAWQRDWLGDPDLALYAVMAVMVWVQIGFPLVIFMAGLERIDPSLYEAAELDGAAFWQRLWFITLPQLRAEIYVVLLWCTIAALKVFGAVYVLTKGGPGGATIVPSYFTFENFFEKMQVGYASAVATVLTIIILLLTAALLRLQARAEET